MNPEKYTPHDDGSNPKGLRNLVVDDNRDAVDMISALLEFAGHNTGMAENGLDAIREARHVRYDAVLLGLDMPIMNGFGV